MDNFEMNSTNASINQNFAKVVFGYTLGYFDLFNGNISNMTTTITKQNGDVDPMTSLYTYDQLNRIKTANKYVGLSNNSWATASLSNAYHEDFNYDANGNILSLTRKNNAGALMDALIYNYETVANGYAKNTNKLGGVDESAGVTPATDDIEDQDFSTTNHDLNNYQYDEIGNLMKDKKEKIENIEWTVYGKIKKITRIAGTSDKDNLTFEYDASGNRVAKHVSDVASGNLKYSTYYVRDAQGNVMAVYDVNPLKHNNSSHLFLTEQHLYGSSRLGMKKADVDMGGSLLASNGEYMRTLGQKSYEFSNHLGNILSVMTDKKLPVDVDSDGTIDYYNSEVISASDYYAFGSKLGLRGFTPNGYAYGFNGQLQDDEIFGTGNSITYEYRIEDTRLGRFLSVDPLVDKFPFYSPYQFCSNSPIMAVELEGLETSNNPNVNEATSYDNAAKAVNSLYSQVLGYEPMVNTDYLKVAISNTADMLNEARASKKLTFSLLMTSNGEATKYFLKSFIMLLSLNQERGN